MPDSRPEEHARRIEDRDRMLNEKLDEMERDHRSLIAKVIMLESSLTVVKLEQTHLKDLMDARLKVIEKSQEIQLSETKQIAQSIIQMGSDVDKSPLGRTLDTMIRSVQGSVDEQSDKIDTHLRDYAELTKWKDRVDGVLLIMKWVGAGGLIALGISILRLIKVLP